jgi:Gluconate 2-dehydrogenase subunit 3
MMERRELFKILGASLIAVRDGAGQHDHGHGASVVIDIENYQPRFFSHQEYGTIDALTDIIIPADDQSPGAHAAGVRFYIDSVLHYAGLEPRKLWRSGLATLDESARARFGKGFTACSPDEKEQLVAMIARNEKAPSTELEHFFRLLKEMTVEAYVLSEAGMTQYLGYKGNTAILEFRGCTHSEHQSF